MKITKVNIPKLSDKNDGLDDIKMDRLDSIVFLAGKNGSGKTRILNKVFATLNSKPKKNIVDSAEIDIKSCNNTLATIESNIKSIEVSLSGESNEQKRENYKLQLSTNSVDKQAYLDIKQEKQKIFGWNLIETSELSDSNLWIRFVPKLLALSDSSSFSKYDLLMNANNINQIGMQNLPNGVFAKIQVVQDRWREATHQDSELKPEEKEKLVDDYMRLNELIRVFLNTSIGRTSDGEATLFGFSMGNSNLSEGQKILLQFCLAIYSQNIKLKDLILVMDEPENHLHPSVIIETLDRIREYNTNGQIWIATHSIPLLAHFDPSLIWFVENGEIRHAGKIPEKVLESLLGDENEIARLQDFISLPTQFALSRHAFECLTEPEVLATPPTDPQSLQIKKDLLDLSTTGKLRVLDYGAGKGRIISNINSLDEEQSTKLIEKLDYIAFDKFDTYKNECKEAIKKAYESSDGRYFNEYDKLVSSYDKGSFNVIILCNVLHEIDPKEWLKLFSGNDSISSLLSDNGIILLIEDYEMPIGEKAYQKGFIVLDTPQLKELFNIKEEDGNKGFKITDIRGDGRLKSHQIPKECLLRIHADSRLQSLNSLSSIAKQKILDIREREKNYQNGKRHGFWVQQFANAQLALEELTI